MILVNRVLTYHMHLDFSMATVNNCVLPSNDILILVDERNYPDDGLADDDSWVDNVSQDEDDLNEFDCVSHSNSKHDHEENAGEYLSCNLLDLTLHTIVEESCEDSELEQNDTGPTKLKEQSADKVACISPSELERYFFFGLGEGDRSVAMEESSSELCSDCSDNFDTIAKNESSADKKCALELSTSRLEKYFLSGFMGFSMENKSDGSVGSDSEGHPSPSQRKKKNLRSRGTPRSTNSSLDNLLLESTDSLSDQAVESFDSSESETGSIPEMDIVCDRLVNADSVKRKKNYRKRELLEQKLYLEKSYNLLETAISYNDSVNGISEPEIKTHLKTNRLANDSLSPKTSIIRKDSFNNWSSDEETNLMMSKMRQFFKALISITTQNYSQPTDFETYSDQMFQSRYGQHDNPLQFSYFEDELIRLMKTVPGINSNQVREMVEYFSSEDTWSDSNDSSDFKGSNHDVDGTNSNLEQVPKYMNIEKNDTYEIGNGGVDGRINTERVLVYTKLIKTILANNSNLSSKVLTINNKYDNFKYNDTSPPNANVMQHIGRKLATLMHDVSIGTDTITTVNNNFQNDSKKSNDSSVAIDVDYFDYSSQLPNHLGILPRSKSHDILLGSANRSWHCNSNSTVNDITGEISDCDRFSWRGSFESALLAPGDSRNKLLNIDKDNFLLSSEMSISKRASVDNLSQIFTVIKKNEQLDRVQSCGSIGVGDNKKVPEIEKSCTTYSTQNKIKTDMEFYSPNVENLINTNSLSRIQSLEFSDNVSEKMQTDSNAAQGNAKSARYRSPINQNTILLPFSKNSSPQLSSLYLKKKSQKGMTSSVSLDDFSISEFCNINKSLGRQRNQFYKRNNILSDSLTSVYSDASDNRHDCIKVKGQIEFAMQYNYKTSAFEIHIFKCKDLAIADTKRCSSDPYVKVYLLPDKSKHGKRKTKVKKHTLNPIFDEIMRFNVSIANLKTRSIWLSVWHSDLFGRNIFLGEVAIDLQEKVFDNPQSEWYLLQEKNEKDGENTRYRGDISIGLKFVSMETQISAKGQLHVLIKEAKHLRSLRVSGTCDTFCKSYLLPNRTRSSKQKTPIFKKSLNPSWNCSFVYEDVTLHELSERALEITVWDHDRLISNQFLGGARFSLGTGEHCGHKVNWMDSKGKELLLWREMMNRPNFWVERCVNLRDVLDFNKEDAWIP